MGSIPVNELCKKLKYEFRNIVLLYEALTHDFDNQTEWKLPFGNIVYKKKKLNRLALLGENVLKFVLAEQAVSELKHYLGSHKTLEKKLNYIVDEYSTSENFLTIGKKLSLKDLIQTGPGFNGDFEHLFQPVIYAIFGAIFVDCGGCESTERLNGLHHTRKLFLTLWKVPYYKISRKTDFLQEAVNWNHLTGEKCDLINIQNVSLKRFLDVPRPPEELEINLGYTFLSSKILNQSLTHTSVKVNNELLNAPTHEILTFLGNVAYQLIICEYFYWHHVNDVEMTQFNAEMISKYCQPEFKEPICKKLEIYEYVVKADGANVYELHTFLESIIGAIYVDSGRLLKSVRRVLVGLVMKLQIDLDRAQNEIPYSLKTYCGSYFHTENNSLDDCDHDLPSVQNSFKIHNINRFLSYGHYLNSWDSHASFMIQAKKEEEDDLMLKENRSEEECNRLEFKRLSLYRTAVRILHNGYYDKNTGDVTNKFHTYGMGENSLPSIQDTSHICPNYTVNSQVLNDRISLQEIDIALDLLIRWLIMCVRILFKKCGQLIVYLLMFVVNVCVLLVRNIVVIVCVIAFSALLLDFLTEDNIIFIPKY